MAEAVWIQQSRELRKLPEAERVRAIKEYATTDSFAAAKMVARCISDKAYLKDLLAFAFRRDELDTLRYWLESVAQRAGFRRLLNWIEEEDFPPVAIDFAQYHLRGLMPNTERDRAAFSAFCERIGRRQESEDPKDPARQTNQVPRNRPKSDF